MSFEGYYQLLCAKGHEGVVDIYVGGTPENLLCLRCGASIAWWNLVDTTNGSYSYEAGKEERIDGYIELEVDQPEIACVCKDCGNRHAAEHATYKIPEGGHRIEEV